MNVPVSVFAALRPTARAGLVASLAASTVVLTATPFLIPEVAARHEVSNGTASLISTAQLGGFVVATAVAGRILQPSRALLRWSLLALAVGNVASAYAPGFEALVATRVAAGVAIGLLTWLGWQEVFGDEARMGDVAVIGPIVGAVAAPVLGLLADGAGERGVYLLLAAVVAVALAFPLPAWTPEARAGRRVRHRPVAQAAVLLGSLLALTLGGSSVFIFAAVLGRDRAGLGAFAVAVGLSLNALASIPSARFQGPRPLGGLWLLGPAICAVVMGTTTSGPIFLAALTFWGFSFWMAVPAVFGLLATRSRYPAERAGDAHAVMAAGRVVGPLLGGVVMNAASSTVTGLVGGAIVAAGAVAAVVVEVRGR